MRIKHSIPKRAWHSCTPHSPNLLNCRYHARKSRGTLRSWEKETISKDNRRERYWMLRTWGHQGKANVSRSFPGCRLGGWQKPHPVKPSKLILKVEKQPIILLTTTRRIKVNKSERQPWFQELTPATLCSYSVLQKDQSKAKHLLLVRPADLSRLSSHGHF